MLFELRTAQLEKRPSANSAERGVRLKPSILAERLLDGSYCLVSGTGLIRRQLKLTVFDTVDEFLP